MKFILLVVLQMPVSGNYHNIDVKMQEFDSKAQCEHAIKIIRGSDSQYRIKQAACIYK